MSSAPASSRLAGETGLPKFLSLNLLDLSDDLLLRIFAHLLPRATSSRLACSTHSEHLRSGASLSLSCARLRALWQDSPALRSLTTCASCGDRPWLADAAALLRAGARVHTVKLGKIGWARCNVSHGSLRELGRHGRFLVSLDMSAVELHGRAGSATLTCLLRGLCSHGALEKLALWAGDDSVVDILVHSSIVSETRLNSLALHDAPLKPSHKTIRALIALLRATNCSARGGANNSTTASDLDDGITSLALHCRPSHRFLDADQDMPLVLDDDDGNGENAIDDGEQHGLMEGLETSGVDVLDAEAKWTKALMTPMFLARTVSLTLCIPGVKEGVLLFASSHFPRLRSVQLYGSDGVSGETMRALVTAAPKLSRVALRDCKFASEQLPQVAAALGRKLVELVGCVVFTDPRYIEVFSNLCPKVERLGIVCRDENHIPAEWMEEEHEEHEQFQNAISQQAWDRSIAALCKALSDTVVELDIETAFLSDHAVQEAVAAARRLRELTVRWSCAPDGSHDFWMLRGKTHLRSLSMLRSTRNLDRVGMWQWSATSIVNVSWYCRQFCRRLEHLRISVPTLPPGRDSSRVWRALDRLEAKAPRICTSLIRSKLHHPYGKQDGSNVNPLDVNWNMAMHG
jgi:hypothetical protein